MPFGVLVQVQSRAPDRNSSVKALLNICFRGFFHLKETSFLTIEEVVDKMHSAGYEDFNVDVPSTLRFW